MRAAEPLSADDWTNRALAHLRAYIDKRDHWAALAQDAALSHDQYITALQEVMRRRKGWHRQSKILLLIWARGWAAAYYRLNVAEPQLDADDDASPALMVLNTVTARAADFAETKLQQEGFDSRPLGIPQLEHQLRRNRVAAALRQYGQRANMIELARIAGVSRATLYRIMSEPS